MTVLADRYELNELLGSGGMAHVYAALDRQLGRRVAVKLVRADLLTDGHSRQRLLREARSAASFHHPNSVAVFDVGEHEQQPFIVMELVEGESLLERLQAKGRLDASETARIGAGVLSALEAAHERGLVHRDIKPGNVLLPHRGGVKLADFGIAKAAAENAGGLTAAGDVMGTPKYLSPEQVAGHTAVPASDLYSLGVVLYECLAGKPPFTAENPVAVALAHQREPVPSLRRAARDAPAPLVQIVEQALAKDPAERFADAATMRRALEGEVSAAAPTVAPGRTAANATTTALAANATSPRRSTAPTTAVPDDEQRTGAAPPPQPPPRRRRRKGLVVLAIILALAIAALLAVVALRLDPAVDEAPEDDPVEEPLEDAPEPAPEPEEAPEPEPEEAPEPADPPGDEPGQPPPEEEGA